MDGEPDFDFVVGPAAPGEDEDLPQPRRRQLPGSPRRYQVLLACAAAIAAAVVVVSQVAGSERHTPTAAHPPAPATPATTVAVPGGDRVIVTVPGDHRAGHDTVQITVPRLLPLPGCPTHSVPFTPACTERRSVPRAFRRAVHDSLPGTSLVATRTEVRASGIWTRSYTARIGAATLRIEVRPGPTTYPLPYQSLDDGFRAIVYAQRQAGPRAVQVMVTAPSGRAPYDRQVRRLAADPRLLAVH